MSVINAIETDLGKIFHFLVNPINLAKAAPQIQSAALLALQILITASDVEAAVAADGLNITVDEKTIIDIRMLIVQFKAELKQLGINV